MTEKLDKLKKIVDKVNKTYKSSTAKIASEVEDYEIILTPFPTLNGAMKGLPRGKFTTIAGPEHVGKGALLVQIAAYNQSIYPNFTVMWDDYENSFDKEWAVKLGLDLDRVIFRQYTKDINTIERMWDMGLDIIKEQVVDMWIMDSIGAMLPKGDVYSGKEEKSLESSNMLNLQRKLGEFYRKANIYINRDLATGYKGCATIMVGQVYNVPTTTGVALEAVKGGNAVKHWAHVRLKMRRGPKADWPEPVKIKGIDGKVREVYPGWSAAIKIDKTRLNASESQEILLPFYYGRGFDSLTSTISAAMGLGIINRVGAYYECSLFSKKVQGKEEVIKLFKEDSNLLSELGKLVDTASIQVMDETGLSKVLEDTDSEE